MKILKVFALAGFGVSLFLFPSHLSASERVEVAANPCAMKGTNPCAANPCGMRNPCAMNPCAPKQPCGMEGRGGEALKEVIEYGKRLWNDPSLGRSGLSCNSCHAGGRGFKETAKRPYPHYVDMPKRVVTLDQMINFCMTVPMKADPLAWDSKELTALSAYLENVVLKEVRGMRQPCAANPCALKNPCSGR